MRALPTLILWAASALVIPVATAQPQAPFFAAVDPGVPPMAQPRTGGGVEGFQVDLFTEVARRLGRGIAFEVGPFSALIPALQAGRYDFLAAPVAATEDLADTMLFTQGYLWTGYQFGIRAGAPPLGDWDDLKGKTVAVARGTPFAEFAESITGEYGFTVAAFARDEDAARAVVSGKADAALSGSTTMRVLAARIGGFAPDWVLPETRIPLAAPFRLESADLRGQVDDALKCMKQDGTVARLSQKWFGTAPAANDLEHVVAPGHGIADLPGHDPDAPDPDCERRR